MGSLYVEVVFYDVGFYSEDFAWIGSLYVVDFFCMVLASILKISPNAVIQLTGVIN